MARAIATEEDFSIQYDDNIVCDVCKEVRCILWMKYFTCLCDLTMQKEGEENNEMIFCDSCNICVHQVWLVTAFKVLNYFKGTSFIAYNTFMYMITQSRNLKVALNIICFLTVFNWSSLVM